MDTAGGLHKHGRVQNHCRRRARRAVLHKNELYLGAIARSLAPGKPVGEPKMWEMAGTRRGVKGEAMAQVVLTKLGAWVLDVKEIKVL